MTDAEQPGPAEPAEPGAGGPTEPGAGGTTDPQDVEALREEVERLRQQNEDLKDHRSVGQRVGAGARVTAVILLTVIGTLCFLVAPPAIFARNQLLNTDRYVQTLKPVASDPGVQAAVIAAVDKQVDANIDINSLVKQTLPPKAAPLAGPLESAFEGLVNTIVTRFVQSDKFPELWVAVNRAAHEQLTYVLTGKNPPQAAASIDSSGKVLLNLAPIEARIKDRLVAAGLGVAKNLPASGPTIELVQLKGVEKTRHYVRLLNTAADWLPWIGLVAFAGAIAAARKRRRMLFTSALCIAGAMAVLGLGLNIGRTIYLQHVPADQIPHDTAQFLYDTLIRYFRLGIRIIGIAALLIAVVAWLFGPSRPAVSIRSGVRSLFHRLGGHGVPTKVGLAIDQYVVPARVTIVIGAILVLILWTNPGWGVLITVVVIAALLMLLLEVLRPHHRSGGEASTV